VTPDRWSKLCPSWLPPSRRRTLAPSARFMMTPSASACTRSR
jgi:hypothetical protein